MKLYYAPGACSLATHITLLEAGLPHTLEQVDTKTHRTGGGADFYAINPKGYVPAMQLDDGSIFTEGVALMQYLADQKPDSGLAPKLGTMERYRLMEWMTWISSEVHKGFGPLWSPKNPEEVKEAARAALAKRFAFADAALGGKDYLMGTTFTVADAYLFTIVNWTNFTGIDISAFANLGAFMARVSARPQVQAAMRAEGLLK
jgi:glutathione S-transferase